MFLQHFYSLEDRTELGWRNVSVSLLDNASYHTTRMVIILLEQERVRGLHTEPYSFLAAPVERFLPALKSSNLTEAFANAPLD
jgi:transposase